MKPTNDDVLDHMIRTAIKEMLMSDRAIDVHSEAFKRQKDESWATIQKRLQQEEALAQILQADGRKQQRTPGEVIPFRQADKPELPNPRQNRRPFFQWGGIAGVAAAMLLILFFPVHQTTAFDHVLKVFIQRNQQQGMVGIMGGNRPSASSEAKTPPPPTDGQALTKDAGPVVVETPKPLVYDTTLAIAAQQAGFDLLVPGRLPDKMALSKVRVWAYEGKPVNHASLIYEDGERVFHIEEQQILGEYGWGAGYNDRSTVKAVTINGQKVALVLMPDGNAEMRWEQGDVSLSMRGELSEGDVLMVARSLVVFHPRDAKP